MTIREAQRLKEGDKITIGDGDAAVNAEVTENNFRWIAGRCEDGRKFQVGWDEHAAKLILTKYRRLAPAAAADSKSVNP